LNSWPLSSANDSFEKNLGHHPFVFDLQKMIMKHGHTSNHKVSGERASSGFVKIGD
jgi:hypothetical protein